MQYVTYDYYKSDYLGSITDENEFNKYVRDATFEINRYTFKEKEVVKMLKKDDRNADTIRYTMCKLIDNIKQTQDLMNDAIKTDIRSTKGIASESVLSHNVSFEKQSGLKVNELEQALELSNVRIMQKYLLPTGLLYRGL